MIAMIDGGTAIEVKNDVKVIVGDGKEIHITITHEGVIGDAVLHGEVVDTFSEEHPWHLLEDS